MLKLVFVLNACVFLLSSTALGETIVDAQFSRLPPDTLSGSKHSIEENCGLDARGKVWPNATARLSIQQSGGTSRVEVEIDQARPRTYFTTWLRVKGEGYGGSPLTGGGATPLAPQTDLDNLITYSPFGEKKDGSNSLSNGFWTDDDGNAKFSVNLDFPVVGGAYNFGLATLETPLGPGYPVAIINPALPGHSGPFFIRLITHCSDNLGHGLAPGNREAWFQFP
jgi:hypothetical protein